MSTRRPQPPEYVFGYGSLVAGARGDVLARLPGHRRVLGVAMDNERDLAGYKFYRRPDGRRPAVHVAFLDLVGDVVGPAVNGVCVEVDPAGFAALDARERNYDRFDVTRLLEAEPPGRTWAYLGSVAGRARLARGLASGNAVVARGYLDAVEAGFEALGAEELAAFRYSSALDTLRVEDLERVDL